MKKILSITLAIALCISLFPLTAAAATPEENDNVVSYKITSDAIKNDVIAGSAHNITTNEDGKLTIGTTVVDATVFNVLANLQGARTTKSNIIDNAETAFVTYRTLDYNFYSSTTYVPLRVNEFPVSGLESENGVAKVYTMPSTINLSYTAPYELMGRNYYDNNHGLTKAGVYETLKLLTVSGDKVTNNMETSIGVRRPGYMVRIKVENPGVYNLKAYNNFTVATNDQVSYSYIKELGSGILYNVDVASECDVYVIPVSNEGFEFEYSNTGKPTYALIGGARNNTTWNKNAIKLSGTYSSYPGTVKQFADNIELAAGEYIIFFEVNKDTVDTTNYSDTSLYSNSYYQNFVLSGIDLIPAVSEEETAMREAIAEPVEEAGLSDTATVNVYTRDIDGSTSVQTATKHNQTIGANFTASAETVIGNNYEFMYWEKGLGTERRVVSDTAEYTLKAVSGATHLTAVYKSKESTTVPVIFFNGNGDELSKATLNVGDVVSAPSSPSISGGAQFLGWKLEGKDVIYTSEQVNAITASGDRMIFVAQFADDEAKKDITITVNGVALADKKYYGEEITVTADATSNDKTFAYWKKGDEIVSFETTYTFKAWENCTLTAVYSATAPSVTDALKKIIVSGGMAEFIGLDNAIEKGVIFRDTDDTTVTLGNATHGVAMMTDGNQLAFENDLTGVGATNYIGYAILSDGKVVYDK